MLHALITICAFILTILILVGVHELGHYSAARLCGVKVLKFSIGFGKKLFSFTDKKGTDYVFAAIPLGGYVQMLDENETVVEADQRHRAFNHKPIWQRSLIILAGPLFNFIFAIFALMGMYLIGIQTIKPVLGDIVPFSIADQAGLRTHHTIIAIDNKPVVSWQDILMNSFKRIGDDQELLIKTKKDYVQYQYHLDIKNWRLNKLNPDPLESLGIKPYHPTGTIIIKSVQKGSNAETAGLKAQDQIIALNHQPAIDLKNFYSITQNHINQPLLLTIKRGSDIKEIAVKVAENKHLFSKATGAIGVFLEPIPWPKDMVQKIQLSPFAAWQAAWKQAWNYTQFNVILIGKLLTGKLSFQSMGGPLSIMKGSGIAVIQGLAIFLNFLAFISITLGLINLLPIPGLDGSHLVYYLFEKVRGQPLAKAKQALLIKFGMIILFLIMVHAFVNDLARL